MNFVKKGRPTFNICNICGRMNFPDVARKNKITATIRTTPTITQAARGTT